MEHSCYRVLRFRPPGCSQNSSTLFHCFHRFLFVFPETKQKVGSLFWLCDPVCSVFVCWSYSVLERTWCYFKEESSKMIVNLEIYLIISAKMSQHLNIFKTWCLEIPASSRHFVINSSASLSETILLAASVCRNMWCSIPSLDIFPIDGRLYHVVNFILYSQFWSSFP